MVSRRVVVTGLGVVSSVGLGARAFWSNLLEGRSGIRQITSFDVSDMTSRIAGQVPDFDPGRWLDKRAARRTDPVTHYASAAGDMAIEDSGLDIANANRDRIGIILGTGIGGLNEIEDQSRTLFEKGPSRISPFFIPKMMSNAIAGELAIRYGVRGVNFVTLSACASSAHAIGSALRTIQHHEADVVLSGGSEVATTRLGLAGFCALRAVSTRNDEPERASRPFDRDRDGFVMGDGAAILVLEELEHARRRGARIYAEILGIGSTADAHHMTAPAEDGIGAATAMKLAMADAKKNPADVDYVNAHGTATEVGDRMETAALKQAFGDHARRICISSTKSMIGHLLGAAGAVELVATIQSVVEDRVHATKNLENPDPACDLDYMPGASRELVVRHAISNSFGFGGHNVSILVGKFTG